MNDDDEYPLYAARIVAMPPAYADDPLPVLVRCTVWATDAEALDWLARRLPTTPFPDGAHPNARMIGQTMPARYNITVGPNGRRQQIAVDLTRRFDFLSEADLARIPTVAERRYVQLRHAPLSAAA